MSSSPSPAPTTSGTIHQNVVPAEVGWQFVPQYYTFVNKYPNRLHCFYTKNSTFMHGLEGEDGRPCHGQQVCGCVFFMKLGFLAYFSLFIHLNLNRKFIKKFCPLALRTVKSTSTLLMLRPLLRVVSLFKSLVKCQTVVRPGGSLCRPSSLLSSLPGTLFSTMSSVS